MRFRRLLCLDAPLRIPPPQLRAEVRELVAQLAVAHAQGRPRPLGAHARLVEGVPAPARFPRHVYEVRGDRGERIARLAEALELRVLRVAARAAGQHRLGEQGFTPQRDEAGRVEIAWMDRPEPHYSFSGGSPSRIRSSSAR